MIFGNEGLDGENNVGKVQKPPVSHEELEGFMKGLEAEGIGSPDVVNFPHTEGYQRESEPAVVEAPVTQPTAEELTKKIEDAMAGGELDN